MQPVLVKSYSKDTMKFSVEMASGLVKQVVRSSVRFMCEDPEIWKERQTLCKGQAEQAGSIVKFCRDVEEVDAEDLRREDEGKLGLQVADEEDEVEPQAVLVVFVPGHPHQVPPAEDEVEVAEIQGSTRSEVP